MEEIEIPFSYARRKNHKEDSEWAKACKKVKIGQFDIVKLSNAMPDKNHDIFCWGSVKVFSITWKPILFNGNMNTWFGYNFEEVDELEGMLLERLAYEKGVVNGKVKNKRT